MNDYINYYELLGIEKTATQEEIKKAYRTQAKKWHPDVNKDTNALEISKKLNEAKKILLDEEKRKEYDNYLKELSNQTYKNLKPKEKNNTYNENTYNETTYNDYKEETYTKWQYFKLYLKYYKTSPTRKIIAFILVILETIICSILQIINYLLALILYYLGDLLSNLSLMIMFGYTILLAIYIIALKENAPQTIYDWIKSISIILVLGLSSLIPSQLLNILIYKVPIYLSDLNIYLFKKAIGYQNSK